MVVPWHGFPMARHVLLHLGLVKRFMVARRLIKAALVTSAPSPPLPPLARNLLARATPDKTLAKFFVGVLGRMGRGVGVWVMRWPIAGEYVLRALPLEIVMGKGPHFPVQGHSPSGFLV